MPYWSFESIVQKTNSFLGGLFIFFVFLGFLVLVGLRKEVGRILSGLFEGTLKVVEAVEILKEMWLEIISSLKAFFNFMAPLCSWGIVAVAYYFIMKLYKTVGQTTNVTLLTILLTVGTASVAVLLSALGKKDSENKKSFFSQWWERVTGNLFNAFEIMILLLFLTIDWKNPVFLSPKLWGPIEAKIGSFDLMVRGVSMNSDLNFTLWLGGLAILVELVRRLIRIFKGASSYYRSGLIGYRKSKLSYFRSALQMSFYRNLDTVIKFFGFTTVVVLSFFLFPRLKLLSLAFFNFTALIWDLLIPQRISSVRESNDLLSTLVIKTFDL